MSRWSGEVVLAMGFIVAMIWGIYSPRALRLTDMSACGFLEKSVFLPFCLVLGKQFLCIELGFRVGLFFGITHIYECNNDIQQLWPLA